MIERRWFLNYIFTFVTSFALVMGGCSQNTEVMGTNPEDSASKIKPVLSVSLPDSFSEGGSSAVTLQFNPPLSTAIVLDYSSTSNTATGGVDYSDLSGRLELDIGTEQAEISLSSMDDGSLEGDEIFDLVLNLVSGEVELSQNVFYITILDDELPQVEFSSPVASIDEDDINGFVELTVTLEAILSTDVSVDYATADNTALTDGSGTPSDVNDYTLQIGTLIIPAGDTFATIQIPIMDDNYFENATEDFNITLSNLSTNAILGATTNNVISITDDDVQPTLSFVLDTQATAESAVGIIDIAISNASVQTITADYTVADVSATGGGTDYTLANGTVTFNPGSVLEQLSIPTATDALTEGDETFTITLSNPGNTTFGSYTFHTHSITDASPPVLNIGDTTVVEDEHAALTVTLSDAVPVPVSFTWTATDGTATIAGGDFLPLSGSFTIPASQTFATLPGVPTQLDFVAEPTETFTIEITNLQSAAAGDVSGLVTVLDHISSITLRDLEIPATTNTSFDAQVGFKDDSDADGTVMLYWCNHTDFPSCDPEAPNGVSQGSQAMTRGAGVFTTTVSGFGAPNDINDVLNVRVVATDPGGTINSPLNTTATLFSGTAPVTVSPILISSILNNGFDVTVPFTGDDNTNSVANLYYCNATDDFMCDPLMNPANVLTQNASDYSATIAGLSSPNDPGDVFNIEVVVTDTDGVTGSPQTTTVTLDIGGAPLAEIGNLVDNAGGAMASNITQLNSGIYGTGIVAYQYKVGEDASIDCTNSSGYSAEIPVSTMITDNISGLSDGLVTLCAVGKTVNNVWQTYAASSSMTWYKDTGSIETVSITSGNYARLEQNDTFDIDVSLSAIKPYDVILNYKLHPGGLSNGSEHDLGASDGSITITSGLTTATKTVTLTGDGSIEADEKLYLSIYSTNSTNVQMSLNDSVRIDVIDEDEIKIYPETMAFGDYHRCMILGGVLKCWGQNDRGQIGDTTNIDRVTPVVVDAGTQYKQVSTNSLSADHYCGVAADGTLKCWGYNTTGQLGDGTELDKNTPTVIDSGTDYLYTSVGAAYTCGITAANDLKCWGENSQGQMGDTTTVDNSNPTAINAGTKYVKVSAGINHTCAITDAGQLQCWGQGSSGEVGDGVATQRTSPVNVNTGVLYTDVAVGYSHSCGITTSSVLKCWGSNFAGELGDGTTSQANLPQVIDSGVKYKSIALGTYFTCGITVSGAAKCWGENIAGQLGNGETSSSPNTTPISIDTGTIYRSIYTTSAGACGITDNNIVKCWGEQSFADDLTADSLAPVTVSSNDTFSLINTESSNRKCAIDSTSNELSCMASSLTDSTLDGTNLPRYNLFKIDNVEFETASFKESYCAITKGGSLKCGGPNTTGQVGDGTFVAKDTLIDVEQGESFSKIASSNTHVCAISNSGALKCWGGNGFGQVGNSTVVTQFSPVDIDSSEVYSQITVGSNGAGGHTCGITQKGTLKCWGQNSMGQVGDNSLVQKAFPTIIDSGVTYANVSAGSAHTCGITRAGVLKCWGNNAQGQLGDNTLILKTVPVVIDSGTSYKDIMAYANHTCGITSADDLKCWGANNQGELGDGTTVDKLVPTTIDGGTGYSKLYSGNNSGSCAVTIASGTKCWGQVNRYDGLFGNFKYLNPSAVLNLSDTLADNNHVHFSNLVITPGGVNEFHTSVDFQGDLNANATATVWYCNATSTPGCDPETGISNPLTRNLNTYTLTIGGLLGPNNPGDLLNVRVVTADPDGLFGEAFDGSVTLLPELTVADLYIEEGESAKIIVSLSGASTQNVTFDWATISNTATSPQDFTPMTGSSTILAGKTEVELPGINTFDDAIPENLEDFYVDITNVNNAFDVDSLALVELFDKDNGIRVSNLVVSNTTTTSFDAQIDFTDDADANAVATLYYCNKTDDSNCDPLAGASAIMTRNASDYTVSVTGLSSPDDPGDIFKVRAVVTDTGGVFGSPMDSLATLFTGVAPITVGTLSISSVLTDGFDVDLTFTGDGNADSSATLYYCNKTDDENCDPELDGDNLALTLGASFTGTVAGLIAPYDPGDELKLKIVVQDPDGVNNSPVFGDVKLDILAPIASIGNIPSGYTDITDLNLVAYGQGVTAYQYKVEEDTTIDCSLAGGYSGEISVDTITPIDISALADGDVTICLVGKSEAGTWQAYASATTHTWYKDTGPRRTVIITSDNDASYETSKALSIDVEMDGTKPYNVDIQVSTSKGDLSAGSEHDLLALDTITIPAGQTFATKTVNLTGDATDEDDEALIMDFFRTTNTSMVNISDTINYKRFDVVNDDTYRIQPDKISMGADFVRSTTCAIFGGVLKCWGANQMGQLGDGTTVASVTAKIIDPGVSYKEISNSGGHTCGITQAGVLKCWGADFDGQVGDGGSTTSGSRVLNPVVINSGTPYSAVSVGGKYDYYGHSCGITEAGVLRCWGWNIYGQLGDGTSSERTSPRTIDSGVSYKWVSPGQDSFTCGVTVDGVLKCWGFNLYGQLGDGTTTHSYSPKVIDPGVAYEMVDAGEKGVCGITVNKELKCWGTEVMYAFATLPTVLDASDTYKYVVADNDFTCAINTADKLKCWGSSWGFGWQSSNLPQEVFSNYDFKSVAADENQLCGITTDDLLLCTGASWGSGFYTLDNSIGEDLGTTSILLSATHFPSGDTIKDWMTDSLSCVLDSSDKILCSGSNSEGKLGLGLSSSELGSVANLTPIANDIEFEDFSPAEANHTCGISKGGALSCWGKNNYGQLGDGTTTTDYQPRIVNSPNKFSQVETGNENTCAIDVDGKLYCWGYGYLGNGTLTTQHSPIAIDPSENYKEFTSNYYANCGITFSDELKCWGLNTKGQLGTGDIDTYPSPIVIDSGTTYSKIETRGYVTCGITTANELKCWGLNSYGQVGDGTLIDVLTPTVIDSGTSYKDIVVGGSTNCGITTADTVKCWGWNVYGQVGDGTQVDSLVPILAAGGETYQWINTNTGATCGMTIGNQFKCWGLGGSAPIFTDASDYPYMYFYEPVYARNIMPELPSPNDLALKNLVLTELSTTSFSASVEFIGDDNIDASVTLWYCNHTDSFGCDPESSDSIPMVRGAGTYDVTVSGLSAPYDVGDEINVRVVGTDADGVHFTVLDGRVTLAPSLTMVTADFTALEGDLVSGFTANLDAPADVDVLFSWSVVAGTASVADNDYLSASGTVTISAGLTTSSAFGSIQTNSDGVAEPTEYLNVQIAPIRGAKSGGDVSTTVTLVDQTDGLVLNTLSVPTTTTTGFDVQVSYSGDANTDGDITLYYCNQSDDAGCDPLAGGSLSLTQGGGVFSGSVTGLSSPDDPGDVMKLSAVATDTSGVMNSPLAGTATLSAGGAGDILVGSLVISSITTDAFDATLGFSNDSNSDSTATLYYCSLTDEPFCNPQDGANIAMTRNASDFTASITGLVSPYDPGDKLNVEAVVSDPDGVANSPQVGTVQLDVAVPVAVVSNIPNSGASKITELAGIIHGAGIVAYKYKVDEDASIDCTNPAGYSAELPTSTWITDDISLLSDGLVTLCAIGKSENGTWQTEAASTVSTWIKDTSGDVQISVATGNINSLEGTYAVNVDVSISATKTYDVVVDYSTIGSDLTDGSEHDAGAIGGTVTILAGQTSVTKTINFTDDATPESDERLSVILTGVNSDSVIITDDIFFKADVIDEDRERIDLSSFDTIYTRKCAIYSGTLKCWGNSYIGNGTTTVQQDPVIVNGGTNYEMVSSNGSNSCAITTSGDLRCWGQYNHYGHIGDGTTTRRSSPVSIDPGVPYRFVVRNSAEHACAITKDYTLKCWGRNAYGQIGNGDTLTQLSPVEVDPGIKYRTVDLGGSHSCGITLDNKLKCWGSNNNGQMGDGLTANRLTPYEVIPGTEFKKVFNKGQARTCGITNSDVMWCWGESGDKALGSSLTTGNSTRTPLVIDNGTTFNMVTYGADNGCAITTANKLKCWGRNYIGQVGTGDTIDQVEPVLIDGAEDYQKVQFYDRSVCALTTSGALKCWGRYVGGTAAYETEQYTPKEIQPGSVFEDFQLTQIGGCAIKSNGIRSLVCWGNSLGELSTEVANKKVPNIIDNNETYTKVSTDGGDYCAVRTDGELACMGEFESHNLENIKAIQRITESHDIDDVMMSQETNCAVTKGGIVKCLGRNYYDQIDNSNNPFPDLKEVDIGETYIDFSPSESGQSVCGIRPNGELWCWGRNYYYQLGDGTNIHVENPKRIDPGTLYKDIELEDDFACGVTTDGDLKCWGQNDKFQMGDGTNNPRIFPQITDAGTKYKQVSTSSGNVCAITEADTLKCWGLNWSGNLGDNTTVTRSTPVVIDGGTSYAQIEKAYSNTCAITTAGALRCWGSNGSSGRVGNNSTSDRRTPTTINSGTNYADVSVSSQGTCGVTDVGVLKCWGNMIYNSGRIVRYPLVPKDITPYINNANDIYVKDLAVSQVSGSSFYAQVDYYGDADADATLDVWYCNGTDDPTCDPVTDGTSESMTRDAPGAGNYSATVSGLPVTYDPGDTIYIRVVTTNPEVEIGAELNAELTLLPALTVVDTAVSEGDNAIVRVEVSAAYNEDITFNWTTTDASATQGSGDYTTNSGSATITAGQAFINLPAILTANDGGGEGFEFFTLDISSLGNAVADDASGVVGLVDAVDGLTISNLSTSSITSNSFNAQITFTGDTDANSTVSFRYCNETDSPGCDPTLETPTAMVRGAGVFTLSVSGLSTPDDPTDTLNIAASAIDASGVIGTPLISSVQLASPSALDNNITLSTINPSSITDTGFDVTIAFIGDNNADAVATLWYCNETDNFLCDPLAGSSQAMTRNAGDFTSTVAGLGSPNDPGDTLNLAVTVVDADGVANSPVFGDVVLDIATPIAVADNIPSGASHVSQIKSRVYGQGVFDSVVSYRYKIGPTISTDCSYGNDYSAEIAVATIISEDISGLADGTIKLCLVGKSNGGTWQPFAGATENTWYKDTGTTATAFIASQNDASFETTKSVTLEIQIDSPKPYDLDFEYVVNGDLTDVTEHDAGTSGTLQIPFGSTSATQTINLIGDGTPEQDEYLEIQVVSVNSTRVQFDDRDIMRIDVLDEDNARILADQISLGGEHGCAIVAGDLQCWGDNEFGQLGNGTTSIYPSTAWVSVDPGVKYSKVSLGFDHSCAITTQGVLKCWGENDKGRLGDNSTTDRSSPTIIDAGVTYIDISLGWDHTCGITTANELKCWGENSSRQVGDGTTTDRHIPTTIDSGVNYIKVVANSLYSCGITDSNELKCWGQNNFSQLGDGGTGTQSTPFTIDSGTNYIDIAGGFGTNADHTCGITDSNELYCWGRNDVDQLGDGSSSTQSLPVLIDSGTNYSSVYVGEEYTCGITTTDELKCWGLNSNNQLGLGHSNNVSTPTVVDSGESYASLSIADSTSCGITTSGIVKCFGNSDLVSFADDSMRYRMTPMAVSPATVFTDVNFPCARDVNGQISCWDALPSESSDKWAPYVVDMGVAYKDGSLGSCGVTEGGKVKCWGDSTLGQVGNGLTALVSTPEVIDENEEYASIGRGLNHRCAITTAGQLRCWGDNSFGQLGDNTTAQRNSPVDIDVGRVYQSTATHSMFGNHSCAIALTGALYCWGDNTTGQVGDNTVVQKNTPTLIDSGTNYIQVTTGDNHTCGITDTNQLRCWGDNTTNQLGDGTAAQRDIPTVIDGGTTYAEVSAGSTHTCAITMAGELKCWGDNSAAQLGNDSFSISNIPITVNGTNYSVVSASSFGTCAITTGGQLQCWGDNGSNRLGNGLKFSNTVAPREMLRGLASTNEIYMNNDLAVTSTALSISANISFSGDVNADAVVTMYYCNQTDTPNCDPIAGSSVAMTRGAGIYSGFTGALSSPDDVGDTIKVLIRATDPDAVYGEYSTTVNIQP